MTQPYNALYGPPQAPVDNALYYDDTQGMPRQRPADPLRWLADAVGQNKDLPAPQFFMDPRALSMRNILHSGLNTTANWLDGTQDPSLIGPAEVVSPFGFGLAGSGAASAINALARPGRDFRIADDLARQHPGAAPVASVPYGANLRDASNPTSAAHVYDYGLMPGTPRAPVNTNATPYAVMADNAKGSAPGTVMNSMAPKEVVADYVKRLNDTFRDPDQFPAVMKELEADPRVTQAEAVQIASEFYAPIAGSTSRPKALQHAMKRHEKLMESRKASGTIGKLTADNAKGSAPGTVVNSIAEKPYDVRRAEFEQHIKSGKFASEDDVTVPFQYTRLPPNHDDVVRMDQWSTLPHKKEAVDLSKLWATQKSVDGEAVSDMVRGGVKGEPPPPSAYRALDGTIYLVDGHKRMSAAAARGEPTAEALVVGSRPSASAPGLAANSTQQDDQGVMSILRRYGLAD
jgi:hypothetical protein